MHISEFFSKDSHFDLHYKTIWQFFSQILGHKGAGEFVDTMGSGEFVTWGKEIGDLQKICKLFHLFREK